jgi:hypothetical protein
MLRWKHGLLKLTEEAGEAAEAIIGAVDSELFL